MTAITGMYRPARKVYGQWATDWMRRYGSGGWPNCYNRPHLASQLLSIRKDHGSKEAIEFRNYLLWLGVYPVRLR